MQETMPKEFDDPELARKVGKLRQEFFGASTEASLNEKMDIRLKHLEGNKARPEKLVRRVTVGRNDPCPCGSGKKFKKCCIYKVGNY